MKPAQAIIISNQIQDEIIEAAYKANQEKEFQEGLEKVTLNIVISELVIGVLVIGIILILSLA